jgi:CDP-4-dehydro-6-deoxyglucose reductase, E1|tara:strand:+ start:3177 stop:4493 length:1317 start_codon:yes stop_codon:yes gene_type:complete
MEDLEKLKNQILSLVGEYSKKENANKPFIGGITHIPVTGKVVDEDDIKNLVESSLDGWFTSGHFTDKFEKKINSFLGTRHTLFVNSGSSANLIAISALKELYDIQDGDEVITCAVGFPTTINPIIQNNLTPVLVDADIKTYNINPDLVEASITNKTKGIVLAHTLGNPFNVQKIKDICTKYNLFLMEDNCDAFGSKYNNEFTGTFGDVATLSFYPAHHITTGEGGAVMTNNPKLKKIMESLRDWGRDCYCPPGEDNTCKKRFEWQLGGLPHGYDHKYIYSRIGYNLKSTDMQAALGYSQIDKLEAFIIKRKENFQYYMETFKNFEFFDLPEATVNSDPSWFGFPLTVKEGAGFTRTDFVKYLDSNNIGSRLMFGGNLKLQPAFQKLELKSSSDLSTANQIVDNSFWIGLYPGVTFEMIDYIAQITDEFFKNTSNLKNS